MSLISLIGDRRDFGRYKIDRNIASMTTSKWSKSTTRLREGSTLKVYTKLSRQPDLERIYSRSFEYMKRKYDIRETSTASELNLNEAVIPRKIEPKLTAEEAEKISSEIIQSFARNRDMRELLEGAKFFAGASALAGAPGERRARRNISFSS
jgi:hypothetical protein